MAAATSVTTTTRDRNAGQGRRRSSLIETVQEKLHSHFMSTLALCGSAFAMFYLLFSVFPYSGFMVMHLVPGVDSENAGIYAGFLSSSFMVGRAFSAYPWGKIADIYGRKFVLVVSLIVSAIGAIAFGCSTSFTMAVVVRFFMGLGNGTMIACRTAISELAKGDKDLESKGVGLLMSMVGYGMLISPALGGFLSEPLRQYPNANILGGHFDGLLTKYPFLPPNIIACVLSILAGVNVVLSVRETLPEEKRRHWTHAGQDLFKYMLGLLGFDRDNHPEEPSSTVSSSPTTATGIEDGDEDAEWEEDMKILDSEEFSAAAALMATRDSRASYSSALRRSSVASRRRSSVQEAIGGDIEKAPTTAGIKAAMPTISSERTPLNPQDDKKASLPEGNEKVSMGSIMGNETTRTYLVSYWAIAFTSVCQQEAFPLFAMSHFGGLGLEEKTIGIVGTLSGLMFCIGQYFIFTQAMKLFGLVRALRMGAFWGNVPVILMPFSLFMTGWIQILYLSFITGTLMICGSVYLGCNTIGANRTVDSSQRAAMNGLSSLGTSVGRGLGPIVAGFLVAFSMTSGVIPAEFGGWFIYLVLGTIGLVSYWSTLRILDPDEEPDNE